MSEVKKTRNRKPKTMTPDEIFTAAKGLKLHTLIDLTRNLKEYIKGELDEQQKVADLAKDL